ncbi:squalene cyclase [Cellulosimicrobium terreum]|nr:squalene cyclase [Cellulosimicrobium terreum]
MGDRALADWLLDSDPALRWQVERDLLHAPSGTWEATRARVATEGFGALLLARQDPDGRWAGGAFFPAGFFDPPDDVPGGTAGSDGSDGTARVEKPQPWTATTWSLSSLREWGLDPAVLRARHTAELLRTNARWEYDDLPYWDGEVDWCINAFTLANGAWLGVDVAGLRRRILDGRMADGGWNCEWVAGATVSSFWSTLNTLKGLLAYEELTGPDDEVRAARRTGEEYLLRRRLLRRLSTGEVVAPWATRFAFPFRGRYSVLNATDYFRRAASFDGTAPDPRLEEAVEVVRDARRADGTWVQERRDPGAVWFEVDVPAGEPSRWLTLCATLVLRWWDANLAADRARHAHP